jgi:hypothetical protein
MGVKDLLEAKFIALCNELDPSLETSAWERTKSEATFLFRIDERYSAEIPVAWRELVDLIADRTKLDDFLRSHLSEDPDDEDHDDDTDSEDPFTSGELVFDSDGRVHFASDLEDG